MVILFSITLSYLVNEINRTRDGKVTVTRLMDREMGLRNAMFPVVCHEVLLVAANSYPNKPVHMRSKPLECVSQRSEQDLRKKCADARKCFSLLVHR